MNAARAHPLAGKQCGLSAPFTGADIAPPQNLHPADNAPPKAA